MTKVYVQTHGCSANTADSEAMMGILAQSGFTIVDDMDYADVNIINICTVKGLSTSLGEIRKITEQFPEKKLVIAGCISRDLIPQIRKISQEASLVNTHNIQNIRDVVEESLQGNVLEALTQGRIVKSDLPRMVFNKVAGIVPIASGCEDNCSYCSVKLIKGNIFSYPKSSIVNNIWKSVDAGCKEIWLTSQDNGAYGMDKGERKLAILLNEILEKVKGDYKIRIGMMNPRHALALSDDLIQIYQDDRVFKFFHVPIESGNNEILGKMKRKYNVHEFKELISKFRRYVKGITIATDMIVGFPTETELQFQDSLHLMQDLKPDVLNISRYSSRPNTPASRMPQISSDIKKERSKSLTELFRSTALKINKSWIGWEGDIIISERVKNDAWMGRNFTYKPVIVHGEFKLGDKVFVKVKDAGSFDLRAELIDKKEN